MDDHITSEFWMFLRLHQVLMYPRRTFTKERSAERHHEAGRGASEIETVEDDAPAAADGSSSRIPMTLHQPFYTRKVFPQPRLHTISLT